MSEIPPTQPRTNVVLAFFGWVILLIGVLIAGLAGLCTLSLVPSMLSGGNQMFGLGVVIIFGGLPILFGVALVVAGIAMVRAARPKPPRPPQTFE